MLSREGGLPGPAAGAALPTRLALGAWGLCFPAHTLWARRTRIGRTRRYRYLLRLRARNLGLLFGQAAQARCLALLLKPQLILLLCGERGWGRRERGRGRREGGQRGSRGEGGSRGSRGIRGEGEGGRGEIL